ncbi:FABP family protein [Streptomyces somaliensis]|uniref:Ferric nitrobindin-like protein n=1 Tax=Streptomyces somaliensis (strain ATCC 33201 / DSM 40738 / JCM 12659 / KCTC 9044 / NCTC 11332 / NRRL B-12077 / IP 733) TaxID=1134445 RepID=A0AA44DFQ8_STRE0|nr:FABP family protein [Streptomyces somaliensis]MCP9944339.1 FABP family protein [Streptomyces somaliensis]MCP9962423.1 FABP family protein [Streptomyces somaliensis]MCQ0023355.1 FABP family protein [Streptomyces somaliensis DSM 40738]NKY15402.1 FABP family protein [Streptomyces somaliensis DSM 40738]
MIQIPSDLHPDLVPLAFLLGTWEGAGVSDFPGAEKCNFGQSVTFAHDGRDFIEYTSRTWVLDAGGGKVRPLESESGYWRIGRDRKVEVVMVRDQGVVEVWYGELAEKKPQIDLATDAVARTAASGPYSGGKRLYGYVKSDLMWVGEKATPEVPLRPYMSAHLKKVVTPEEVEAMAKSLGDLPDDGIAFFR